MCDHVRCKTENEEAETYIIALQQLADRETREKESQLAQLADHSLQYVM